MSLRTFNAATMTEAMEQVRLALGPDAVIVTTRTGEAGGVEVVAAAPAPEDGSDAEGAPGGGAGGPVLDFRLARRRRNGRADDAPADQAAIAAALDYHGVAAPLTGELIRLAEAADADDPAQALAAALAARLRFTVQPPASLPTPGAPLVLVGPPGAGKTVTAAKLASLCALADMPVALLTTDTARAGGRAQLDHFAGLLDCPLIAVAAPDALPARLEEQADRACIVDTMGVNPFLPAELAGLIRLLRGTGCEVALVLPAGGDAREMSEIAEVFVRAGAGRLIATRLDATRRLGGLLAAADAGLALGHAGVTPYIARGLAWLDPRLLARLLLENPDARGASPPPGDSVR